MTVRELMMMLLMNAKLDDTVSVEIRYTPAENPDAVPTYMTREPVRVTHIGCDGEALIECYDD